MRQNVPARTEKIEMRESGIELLKIFAMILIVICHVSETIRYGSACVPYEDYVLDLSGATVSFLSVRHGFCNSLPGIIRRNGCLC